MSEVIIISLGSSREHHLNLIETETNTKEATDTEQEILIFAMTLLSHLFPPPFYWRMGCPTTSTKYCAICCSLPLPSWFGNLMENEKGIKSAFIFSFTPLGSRQLMAMEGGRKGRTCTLSWWEQRRWCPWKGEGCFGNFFILISVYKSCPLTGILAILK